MCILLLIALQPSLPSDKPGCDREISHFACQVAAPRATFGVILADYLGGQAHDGSATRDNHGGDAGRNSGWSAGDQEGAPSKGKGAEPVRYLEAPERMWMYTLVWLFWPSLLLTLGIWWGLNNWLHMPDGTAWVFLGSAAAIYLVIGLRGPQLLLLASRLLGRQSNPR
jgi:hypothetical protein